MVHAKNYETMSTSVKVMQKKLWPLFFPDTVYSPYAAISLRHGGRLSIMLCCYYSWLKFLGLLGSISSSNCEHNIQICISTIPIRKFLKITRGLYYNAAISF